MHDVMEWQAVLPFYYSLFFFIDEAFTGGYRPTNTARNNKPFDILAYAVMHITASTHMLNIEGKVYTCTYMSLMIVGFYILYWPVEAGIRM